MDYKNFKLIIAAIEEEKKMKMEKQRTEQESDEEIVIDISINSLFLPLLIASLENEKQFFRQLTASVARVDTFFHQTQVQYIVEVKSLIEEVKRVDTVMNIPLH